VLDLKGMHTNHVMLEARQLLALEAIPGWKWESARKLRRGRVQVPLGYEDLVGGMMDEGEAVVVRVERYEKVLENKGGV
jgi:hypothetical protein